MTFNWQLFGGKTVQWPKSSAEWIIWIALLAGIFLALRWSSGTPVAALATATALVGFAIDAHFYIPLALLIVGVLTLIRQDGGRATLSGWRALQEGAYIGGGFLLYELGRYWNEGDLATAQRNAGRVISLEHRLGLAFESSWQQTALRHERIIEAFNRTYSFLFVPFVLGVLVWLLIADDRAYRLLRNGLGISAVLAVITIALFPVAPPRLTPAAGLIDTHSMLGRGHGFINPLAAMPSLHVGWTALAGYALVRASTRWGVRLLALVPAVVIAVTVIVTGNHYWLDGAVGLTFTLVPALILSRRAAGPAGTYHRTPVPAFTRVGRVTGEVAARSGWARFSLLSLGGLLAYLIVGQIVSPGFTDYWGYMVAQIAVTIAVIVWLSSRFMASGGLSMMTHLIVVTVTYIDTFGTAGHLYDRYVSYDKIAHFGGTAALTSAAYDILAALYQRGALNWELGVRIMAAVSVAVLLGAGWEIYEFVADRVFDTYRHAGSLDTIYDLLSDTTGAVVTGIVIWRRQINAATVEMEPAYTSRGSS